MMSADAVEANASGTGGSREKALSFDRIEATVRLASGTLLEGPAKLVPGSDGFWLVESNDGKPARRTFTVSEPCVADLTLSTGLEDLVLALFRTPSEEQVAVADDPETMNRPLEAGSYVVDVRPYKGEPPEFGQRRLSVTCSSESGVKR